MMSVLYTCDICGAPIGKTAPNKLAITNAQLIIVQKMDICPDCDKSFYLWKESRNPNNKSAFEDKEDGVMSKSGRVFIE